MKQKLNCDQNIKRNENVQKKSLACRYLFLIRRFRYFL